MKIELTKEDIERTCKCIYFSTFEDENVNTAEFHARRKLFDKFYDALRDEDHYEIIPIERPKGEWIYNNYGDGCGNWHCSVCKHLPHYATKYMRFLNYCPHCGADMRGVTNV